jgi:hypothetical protein
MVDRYLTILEDIVHDMGALHRERGYFLDNVPITGDIQNDIWMV